MQTKPVTRYCSFLSISLFFFSLLPQDCKSSCVSLGWSEASKRTPLFSGTVEGINKTILHYFVFVCYNKITVELDKTTAHDLFLLLSICRVLHLRAQSFRKNSTFVSRSWVVFQNHVLLRFDTSRPTALHPGRNWRQKMAQKSLTGEVR